MADAATLTNRLYQSTVNIKTILMESAPLTDAQRRMTDVIIYEDQSSTAFCRSIEYLGKYSTQYQFSYQSCNILTLHVGSPSDCY